jgi:hypothetical protein
LAVRRIRILLAGMARMLLGMVTDIIAAHPEMIVSGHALKAADLPAAARKARADVVILAEPAGRRRQDHLKLLYSRPHLKVLSITSDGRRFFLYELRPQRVALGEISAKSLIQAIRLNAKLGLS